MIDVRDFILYFDNVRAVCGLSSDELTDNELSLSMYASSLELALDSLDVTGYNPIKDTFLDLDEDDDAVLYNQVHLFSTYQVAMDACVSLSIKAPKSLSDSKVSYSRWSDKSSFENTIQAIKAKLGQLKNDLEGATAEALPLLSAIKPATDPVTG